jgi:hypothetical protein
MSGFSPVSVGISQQGKRNANLKYIYYKKGVHHGDNCSVYPKLEEWNILPPLMIVEFLLRHTPIKCTLYPFTVSLKTVSS